jgi:chromatin modification-related protein VID21
MQQGRNGQQPNPQQYPNVVPQQARNIANPNAGAPVNLPPNANRPNQLAVPGQNLPHAQMQPLPNGMAAQVPLPNGHSTIPQMPLKGAPQAPMQGMPGMPGMQGMPAQHRISAPNAAHDMRLVMQARQISEQQRQAVQMQQQGQNNQIHNSPPNMRANMNMNGMNQQAFMQNNQAMLAAFNAGSMNGGGTPPANGLNVPSAGPAGSPRMGHPGQPQQPNGSVSQITKLESQFRAQFPTASPDQINRFVRDALNQNLAAQRQSAMHAAAGSGTPLAGMPGVIQNSPQQYAQMLRAQQERQQAAASQQPRSTSAGSGSGMGK